MGRRGWWGLLAGMAVVSVVRQLTWAIARSPETLMRRAPTDDAFIYLALAEHAPRPEFSDGIATTGFHPLYWALLVPVVHAFDGIAAVRAMLVLCVLLHVLSGALLFRALSRRFEALPAFAGAALWLVLPGARTIVVMGVESALLSCCLAGLLVVVLDPSPPTRRSAVLVGALVGLCYLARTDSPLVTLPLVAAWAWRGPQRNVAAAGRSIATSGLVALAVASPWLAYGASRGRPFASDAFRAERLGTSVDLAVATAKRATAELYLLNGLEPFRARLGGNVTNLLVVVGFGIVAWMLVRRRDGIGLAGMAGPVVIFTAYAVAEGYMRDWYELYPFFAICAFAVPAVIGAPARRSVPAWVVPAAVAALLVVAVVLPNHALNPQEGDKWRAAPIAEALLAPDARVGAFNAGIYQFAMRQDVVNLDGVVNPEVLGPLRAGRLCDYLVDHGIDHLVDYRLYLDRAQAADPRLRFVDRIDLTARYAPGGDRVDQRQELVTVDLTSCRAPR